MKKLRAMPYPYRHPNRPKTETDAMPPTVDRDMAESGQASPTDSNEGPNQTPGTTERRSTARAATVPMRIGFALPLARSAPLFSELIGAGVSERMATLRIGRRAIDLWLANPGCELPVPTLSDLAKPTDTVETTWTIPRTTFGSIERRFDPHDILPARLRGRMFGHAVLTAWIAGRTRT